MMRKWLIGWKNHVLAAFIEKREQPHEFTIERWYEVFDTIHQYRCFNYNCWPADYKSRLLAVVEAAPDDADIDALCDALEEAIRAMELEQLSLVLGIHD